jgi:flagellar assembly protein FliH
VSTFEYDFGPLQAPQAPTAPEDAGDLVAAALSEAERIRETARAEGFALGHAEARAALAPATAALEAVTEEARQHAEQTAERLEDDAVTLAFAIAEQILAAQVEADRTLVLDAVRGALRGLVERAHVTVLVHPDDLELVRGAGDELRATLGGIDRWEVQAERRVAPGGALVRHKDGQIDATHTAKLARARDVVREQLVGPHAP